MIRKKAQMKMFESIAVLIVFFFLVAFGIGFYGNYQSVQLDKLEKQFHKLDTIKLSNLIIHSTHLRCSISGTDRGSCVDVYKLKAIIDPAINQDFQQFFADEFDSAEIWIEQLYPVKQRFVIYNNTPAVEVRSTLVPIPVRVFEDIEDTSNFGILMVRVYE
ncbi:MAG: hypothetical protein ACI8Y7_000166 [Candidatus Woesearchaeota archaeon]|jgi:hypothetical protein